MSFVRCAGIGSGPHGREAGHFIMTLEAVDCDVHPAVPGTRVLLPYLEDHWREHVVYRGIADLELTYTMQRCSFDCRPDLRPAAGNPGRDLKLVQTHAPDGVHSRIAILNHFVG